MYGDGRIVRRGLGLLRVSEPHECRRRPASQERGCLIPQVPEQQRDGAGPAGNSSAVMAWRSSGQQRAGRLAAGGANRGVQPGEGDTTGGEGGTCGLGVPGNLSF